MTRPAWVDQAACRGVDDETLTATGKVARRVCDPCPVKAECLDAAMAEEKNAPAPYRYGVRGGLTTLDRERLARGGPRPKRERPPTPVTHGASGYKNHGCHCDVCKAAYAAYQRDYRRRRRAAATARSAP